MSEKNLEGLIATLKREAVEEAQKQAGDIVSKAQGEARAILRDAEARKAETQRQAEAAAKATREKGESALRQAARDLSVSVRNDLLTLLKVALEREVEGAFSPQLIEKAVLGILENVGSGATLELPPDMGGQLADRIRQRLQASGEPVSIRKNTSLVNGFAISKTEEGWTYRITPEEVTELLYTYLSPKWIEILKNTPDA